MSGGPAAHASVGGASALPALRRPPHGAPAQAGQPDAGAPATPRHPEAAGWLAAWPAAERPREKLREAGFAALTDADLVALLLGSGDRRCNVMDMARLLLDRFGSLHNLLHARDEDLRGLYGVGAAKRARVRVVGELSRRALTEQLRERLQLHRPSVVKNYLVLHLGNAPREIFYCMYLTIRHELIAAEESSVGTLSHAAVYPREIARRALTLNAAGLIVAHNHPAGVAEPSDADRELTRNLQHVLAMLDVRLLDHFVVAANRTYSFREHGLL